MIHQLLVLKRPLICIDVESTGLDTKADRIVEIAFQKWEPVSDAAKAAGHNGMTKEWRSLVNPGVPISEAVTRVHHITDEQMTLCQVCSLPREEHTVTREVSKADHDFKIVPSFAQLATSLAKGFTDVDFAGKNVRRFDLAILSAEFARAGVAWSLAGARIIDVDRLEQLGEPRHLAALYEKHVGHLCVECNLSRGDGHHDSCMIDYSHPFRGKKLDGAHQALADVRATTEVIEAQLKRYSTLPRDLDILHAAQFPGMIDLDGKFRFVDGVPCFGQWGKHAGKPMKSADKSYWQFILDKDFSADVKALASDALQGVFPEAE